MKVDRRFANETYNPVELKILFESEEEETSFRDFLTGSVAPGFIETALAAQDSANLTEDKVRLVSHINRFLLAHLSR